MSDDHLQRFATTVAEVQQKNEQRLDEATVDQIARDLGMTDAQIAEAREQSRTAKQQAQTLRSSGNVDDAIRVLELAHGFNPLDSEIMFMLADALYTRSQRTKEDADWTRARDLAQRVVEIAPAHREASSLLGAINMNQPSTKQGGIPVGLIVAVVGVAALAAAVLHFVIGLF